MTQTKELTRHNVRCIRRWRACGTTYAALAKHFKLSTSQVRKIVNNERWVDTNYTPTPPQKSDITAQQRETWTKELHSSRRAMQAAANSKIYAEADYWLNHVKILELAMDGPVPYEEGVKA